MAAFPEPTATTAQRDQECLRRVQGGDVQALGELYDRFTPLLYSLAMRILGDAVESEMAVEETWQHVWRRAAAYDARRAAVAAWLTGIVRGRALEHRRATGFRASGAADSAPVSPEAGEAVAQLDPHEREALELAFFEGLSEGEIAQRCSVDAATVRSWTVEGVTRLRDLTPPGEWL